MEAKGLITTLQQGIIRGFEPLCKMLTHIHTRAHINTHIHSSTHTQTHAHTHIHTHTHTHIHTYTHTHTHRHRHRRQTLNSSHSRTHVHYIDILECQSSELRFVIENFHTGYCYKVYDKKIIGTVY